MADTQRRGIRLFGGEKWIVASLFLTCRQPNFSHSILSDVENVWKLEIGPIWPALTLTLTLTLLIIYYII